MAQLKFSKREIELLRESGNAYVQPDNANSTAADIASDIAKAQKLNPTDDNFVLDTTDYDGNPTNVQPQMQVNAKNPQDAAKQIENLKKNPNTKKVMDSGAEINVKLGENTIKYTKAELNKILFA